MAGQVPLAVNIGDMRIKYKRNEEAFVESQLVSKEPIGQFHSWFEEVRKNPNIIEPNAMCLATANRNGAPSARMVLLKGYGEDGFRFFTNGSSQKGQELDENPRAAITFYWALLNRQIRIEGNVEKLPEADVNKYFGSRPYPSQIGAAVSEQSSIIPSRDSLIEKANQLIKEYPEGGVPKPSTWGGYIVVPQKVEFWQGQTDRLHDRIVFRKISPGLELDPELHHEGTNGWYYERLAP